MRPQEVSVSPRPLERFAEVLGDTEYGALEAVAREGVTMLDGRALWCINSTAQGGGVAEMLGPLVSEARGAGVDARWIVIEGDEPFFRVTKRIHNRLHGQPGDGGELGDEQRAAYEAVVRRKAA